MKILHVSDTTLSGSPYRIAKLFSKYTKHQARHMVWTPVVFERVFPTDLVASEMKRHEIDAMFKWADVIHYHNRFERQLVFRKHHGLKHPEGKPCVIQMHSPRESEDFSPEINSKMPIAVIAQYHVREWPERDFMVPNVVDIHDELMKPVKRAGKPAIVSYAPSNCTAKGWDDKGYGVTAPVLKKMQLARRLKFQLIVKRPFEEAMRMKQLSDIGIDEFVTGSYHLSSLEYLSMGCATIARLDAKTEAAVKEVSGANYLPWVNTSVGNFKGSLEDLLHVEKWREIGRLSRVWMERYWNPEMLCDRYERMYEKL